MSPAASGEGGASSPLMPELGRRPMNLAGGAFGPLHEATRGPPIDWSRLDLGRFSPDLLGLSRRVWLERTQSELRSIQIMTRFMEEVLGAGDPIDVYAWAADLVRDEVRHTALCREACLALGVQPVFPEPRVELLSPAYLEAPMASRALTTAMGMLAINETLSSAFIEDLAARCQTPGFSEVLASTIADEEQHGELGWAYVEASLLRFERSTLPSWRHLVKTTLAPHFERRDRALAGLEEPYRRLEAHPEPERAALGLFSPARQALVFQTAWKERLEPRLRRLELLE